MYQSEYDELKEQIYRLKQYVDYQDQKMRSLGFCDIFKAINLANGSWNDEAPMFATFNKTCHELNLEMVKRGIVTQESITKTELNKDSVDLKPIMFPNLAD